MLTRILKIFTTLSAVCLTASTALAEKTLPLLGGNLLPGTQESQQAEIAKRGFLVWLQELLFVNVITTITGLAAAVAVVGALVGAYQYITAGGDTERVQSGTRTLIWSIVGLLVITLAFVIVQVIVNIEF